MKSSGINLDEEHVGRVCGDFVCYSHHFQAPAKLNLSLHVLSKREDGYHEIESEMMKLHNLYDDITLTLVCVDKKNPRYKRDGVNRGVTLGTDYKVAPFLRSLKKYRPPQVRCAVKLDIAMPQYCYDDVLVLEDGRGDDKVNNQIEDAISYRINSEVNNKVGNNIIQKAIGVFFDYLVEINHSSLCYMKNIEVIEIDLHKRIPIAAGLGGGSSDAAAVMQHLNLMLASLLKSYGLQWTSDALLSHGELCDLAPKIGADVAFFLQNYDVVRVGGIGEKIYPMVKISNDDYRRTDVENNLSSDDTHDTRKASLDVELWNKIADRVLLFNPGVAVSTAKIFQAYDDELKEHERVSYTKMSDRGNNIAFQKKSENDFDVLQRVGNSFSHNDLYLPVCRLYRQVCNLKNVLLYLIQNFFQHDVDFWGMSGSGATYFVILKNREVREAFYVQMMKVIEVDPRYNSLQGKIWIYPFAFC